MSVGPLLNQRGLQSGAPALSPLERRALRLQRAPPALSLNLERPQRSRAPPLLELGSDGALQRERRTRSVEANAPECLNATPERPRPQSKAARVIFWPSVRVVRKVAFPGPVSLDVHKHRGEGWAGCMLYMPGPP